jgi:hypothetical protein
MSSTSKPASKATRTTERQRLILVSTFIDSPEGRPAGRLSLVGSGEQWLHVVGKQSEAVDQFDLQLAQGGVGLEHRCPRKGRERPDD